MSDMPDMPELKRGHCYLVKENSHSRGFEIFAHMISNGSHGICFTREYPGIIAKKYGLEDVPIYWFCHSIGDRRMDPKRLGLLEREIHKFMHQNGEGVILLDSIEYLIINNDFQRVIRSIHSICEAVMQNSPTLLIPINPDTLDKRDLALLERNLEVIDCNNGPK